MTKYLLGVLVGVFAGAFVIELLDRHKSGMIGKMRQRAKDTGRNFRRAFAEGYRGVPAPNGRPPTTH